MACCQCFVITIDCKHHLVFHLIMAVRHGNVIVNIQGIHYSIVSIATRLRVGRFGVRISAEQRHLSLLRIVQTCSGAHPASSVVVTGVLSLAYSDRGMMFYSHPNLAPRFNLLAPGLFFLILAHYIKCE